MAFRFIQPYGPQDEQRMREFFQTLSEKDRRRFAALEAQRLGRGGKQYIAEVLCCSTRTLSRGVAELDQLPADPAAGRVRRRGGGRKKSRVPAATGAEPGIGA
jgi:hypothetical protein